MFFLKSMTSVGEQIISITSMFAGASVSGILSRPSQGDTVENRTGRVNDFQLFPAVNRLPLEGVGRQLAEAKEEISIEITSG
jgi:hypothetical protein